MKKCKSEKEYRELLKNLLKSSKLNWKVRLFTEVELQQELEKARKEDVWNWVEGKLDKAREEGKRESYRCPYCMFTVSTAGQLRHHIRVRHKKEFEDS